MIFVIQHTWLRLRALGLAALVFAGVCTMPWLEKLVLVSPEMWLQFGLLFGVGLAGGILNAVAGGAVYILFPVLVTFMGIPPLQATMTTKVAIWAGSVTSSYKFTKDIQTGERGQAIPWITMLPVAVGSIAGAILLSFISNEILQEMVPWLMLLATLILVVGKDLTTIAQKIFGTRARESTARLWSWRGLAEFIVGIYGGFFAAGMAFFLLAIYQVAGERDPYRRNVLKAYAQCAINTVSASIFVFVGGVVWPIAAALMAGMAVGGWVGAYVAKCLPATWIRWGTVIFASLVTGKLFGLY